MLMAVSGVSTAAGMIPETSVVLINAADGEGVINVTNTDSQAVLLYTSLVNLPEDKENFLIVTPPVARVEPGEVQLVRFIIQSEQPITTQRLKRVSFEGIPQKDPDAPGKIGMTVRQNLAVLVTPADLPRKEDPWTLLEWHVAGNMITVKNTSRYVVRLNQQVNVLPSEINLVLPRTYMLPGQADQLKLPAGTQLSSDASIRIYPATLYGFSAKPFEAPLNKQ